MYCKQCGREYPKNTRVCKKCGIALSGGHPPAAKGKKVNVALIVTIAAAVVIAAVLLIVGLAGKVPDKLLGTWYETSGLGPEITFKVHGELEYVLPSGSGVGTYEFDNASGQGTVDLNVEEYGPEPFVCDGITLEFADMQLTHAYVERFDMTGSIEDLLDQVGETANTEAPSE